MWGFLAGFEGGPAEGAIFPFSWSCRKIHFARKRTDQFMNAAAKGTAHDLHRSIRSRIDTGALRPGERLLSTRALAAELGVSRSTVVVVYEQLAAEGYIETAAGARARVAPGIRSRPPAGPQPADGPPQQAPALSAYGERVRTLVLPQRPVADGRHIDFLYGALADDGFPKLAWRRLHNRALNRRQPALYYGAPEGEVELRAELRGYLARARGLSCTPEQILIVQGAQQAIDLCARVLIDAGDRVVLEEPGYPMARRTFESVGARIVATPVDEQGLVVSALPASRCALAYVTPSHQFPLGAVMSIGRRQALLAWARRHSSWIVEDDYDSEFRYGLRPVDPLQSLDTRGCVVYVGTFSKALSPQLRLGYLVLPPALVRPFRHAKQLADRHAPVLEQRVLAEFMRSGAYERHLRRLRRENERRRAALVGAISTHLGERARVEGTDSGLHAVVWLRDVPMRAEPEIVAGAKALGVGVWPVSPLYAERTTFRTQRCAGLVLGYAGLTTAAIEEGIGRLARAVRR
jgi:GntR family transcriptional regulator/MocR family aminotransferase